MKQTIIKSLLFFLCMLFTLELFIRTTNVAPDYISRDFDREYSLDMIGNENFDKKFYFTYGKLANIKTNIKINNYGWPSFRNYYPKNQRSKNKKCVAIIGDSYTAGNYINPTESYAYVLDSLMGDDYEVYSFGLNGLNLSSYSDLTRYVNNNFKPDIYIFNLRESSISKSISNYGRISQTNQIKIDNNIITEQKAIPKTPNIIGRYFLQKTALLRYLTSNFTIRPKIPLLTKFTEKPNSEKSKEFILKRAVEYEIQKIKLEISDLPFLFVHDADRFHIYSSFKDQIPNFYIQENKFRNDSVPQEIKIWRDLKMFPNFLDLTDDLNFDFSQKKMFFEFSNNLHWNKHGNYVVGNSIFNHLKNHGFLNFN
tara:strand:- start:16355 stop:17458 length:1104 start_codon:yes stop_codon:yes gene_type:complete